jgi:protein gp37
MGRSTGWWDDTWNPVGGCSIASPGCINCYAAQLAATQQTAHQIPLYLGTTEWRKGKPHFNGRLQVLTAGHGGWSWPLTWPGARRPKLGPGNTSLIFVGDMADVFHENRPTSIIDRVVTTITSSKHIGQLLTKRADVMAAYFAKPRSEKTLQRWREKLWLGFSAERQQEFDARWPYMRQLAEHGWTVFVSVAPMLAPVTLPADFLTYGERAWVICSGEQGPNARPMDLAWARALRDQCKEAGVRFFMLQCDRRQPIPQDLFVRQFPAVGDAT